MPKLTDVRNLLYEASFVRDKLALLAQASRALSRAQMLSRLAQRLRVISNPQRHHFATQGAA